MKQTSFLSNCCDITLFYFITPVGGKMGCKSDACRVSDKKASLPRLKKDIKKTSFLGNCCGKKCSTLPVYWRINKVQVQHTLFYNEVSTQEKICFYYFQKHKKICIFIFILDFGNSTGYLEIYMILVKTIFFVYIKAAFTVISLLFILAGQACHSTSI